MSFNIFKHNSYCVGGKHYSPTTIIYGDITNKNVKLLRGTCMMCSRNRSLIVSDRTIQGEGLGDFFKHLGKAAGSAAKNDGKKILNNPGRALEIAGNIGTAAATKNPKLIASTAPTLLNLFIKGRGYTKLKVCRVKVCRVKVCRVKVCRVKVCGKGLSGKGLSGKGLSGKGLSGKGLSGKGLSSKSLSGRGLSGKGLYLGKIH